MPVTGVPSGNIWPSMAGHIEADQLPDTPNYNLNFGFDTSSLDPPSNRVPSSHSRRLRYRHRRTGRGGAGPHGQNETTAPSHTESPANDRALHSLAIRLSRQSLERIYQGGDEKAQQFDDGMCEPQTSSRMDCDSAVGRKDRDVEAIDCSMSSALHDTFLTGRRSNGETRDGHTTLRRLRPNPSPAAHRTTTPNPDQRHHPRSPTGYPSSHLRCEAIRATMSTERLEMDDLEVGNATIVDEGFFEWPEVLSQSDDYVQSSLQALGVYRENGLLRVRPSMAPTTAGDKVLIHSVPRVRKRRHKKLEIRLGPGDHPDVPHRSIPSRHSSASPAIRA